MFHHAARRGLEDRLSLLKAGEAEIVWNEDVRELSYVRESLMPYRRRRGAVRWHTGRTIGYSTLRPDSPGLGGGWFLRRVFWLAPHDRKGAIAGEYPPGGHLPSEAVDPRTVRPGVLGAQTTRCRR